MSDVVVRTKNEPRDNAVQCHACAEVIVSLYRHDFKTCKCGDVSVDGGYDYLRRVWADRAEWTEMQRDENDEWRPVGYGD